MTEESIEDVKQAYALLFKENAELRAECERLREVVAPPVPEPMLPDLYERIAEAHDASLDDDHRACRSMLMEVLRLIAPTKATHTQPASEPDDDAVDRFAAAMKEKLAQARAKGRGGWQTCPPEELSRMLREHVEKGDPRDVANFCMFLWSLGHGIAQAEPVARDEPGRPDIIERLSYHALERDDMTLDDCLSFLAEGWRKVHGRTERQLIFQITAMLAASPTQPRPQTCAWSLDDEDNGIWQSSCGELWSFIDGGPKENRVTFCHHCGGTVGITAQEPTE